MPAEVGERVVRSDGRWPWRPPRMAGRRDDCRALERQDAVNEPFEQAEEQVRHDWRHIDPAE